MYVANYFRTQDQITGNIYIGSEKGNVSVFLSRYVGKSTIFQTDFVRIKTFPKGIYSLKKEFAPRGENYFLQELSPKGRQNENGRVTFSEIFPIYLI